MGLAGRGQVTTGQKRQLLGAILEVCLLATAPPLLSLLLASMMRAVFLPPGPSAMLSSLGDYGVKL